MGLKQQHRLRSAATIRALQRRGQQWRHPLVIFLAIPNERLHSRFGFVASRRVGNAVTRNRVRRLLREAIRLHLHEIAPGWDCLLIARTSMAEATYADVEAAVLQLLARAGILVRAVS